MKNTLIQLLHDTVNRLPDKEAVVHGNKSVTYGELWKKACGVAHYLVRKGIQPQQCVSILLENSPEYIAAYYGVLMSGGAAIGLNTAAKSRDLVNWIQHSESRFVIADTSHNEFEKVEEALQGSDTQILCLGLGHDQANCFDDWDSLSSEVNLPESLSILDPSTHLASIIYTSGTTGKPKGVMLSHANLYQNISSILEYLDLNENDSVLNVLPFYYSYGNSVLHIHMAVGGRVVLENSMLYPQKILAKMSEQKVTGFSGVPSTFNLLLSRTDMSEFNLSSIRYMTQAGGAMAPANIERLKKVLPDISFFVMYGQTEASARLSYLPPEKLIEKAGSIGIGIPGVQLEVMNENHQIVEPGTTGEIYAKGENIMLGYWKDADATELVIHDGWLKTGDLAYKDSDGFLYIVGRSSEMIKSGAHRISPKDIEEVILELEGIEEVAVVGKEDELLGQVIKAVIVKSPSSVIDKMKIMRHCKENLANYKIPKLIEFADEIPRTASGKVRRFMLQN